MKALVAAMLCLSLPVSSFGAASGPINRTQRGLIIPASQIPQFFEELGGLARGIASGELDVAKLSIEAREAALPVARMAALKALADLTGSPKDEERLDWLLLGAPSPLLTAIARLHEEEKKNPQLERDMFLLREEAKGWPSLMPHLAQAESLIEDGRGFDNAVGAPSAGGAVKAGPARPTPNRLAPRDPDARREEAVRILGGDREAGVTERLGALRALEGLSLDRHVQVLTGILDSSREQDTWYFKREAARALGAKADEMPGPLRESAIAALTRAKKKSDNPSLGAMIDWAMERLKAAPLPPSPATGARAGGEPSGSGEPMKIDGLSARGWWVGFMSFIMVGVLGLSLTAGLTPSPTQAQTAAADGPRYIGLLDGQMFEVDPPAPKITPTPAAAAEPASSPLDPLKEIARNTDRSAKALEKITTPKENQPGPFVTTFLPMLLAALLIGGVFFVISKFKRGGMGGGTGHPFGSITNRLKNARSSSARFTDVLGVDDAKAELEVIVNFLRNPEPFRRMGARLPKGALLVGPPGTGKTLTAKAVANEAGVSFLSISGSDFVEMFVGVGASRVRDLFAQAKRLAPSMIFIDELDAIGRKRGASGLAGNHDEREQTLNQLLVEMDGFESENGVVVLAATNRPEVLDEALLRPGRLDRKVYFGRPDGLGREAQLQHHAAKPGAVPVPLAPDADLRAIARQTTGLVGADMENIINEAAIKAVESGATLVGMTHLIKAINKILAGGQERMIHLSEEEKEVLAVHEGGHALAEILQTGGIPSQISIVPQGGQALGFTAPASGEDRFLMTQSAIEDQLVILMGGRAAEELVYGQTSTGPGADLSQATRKADIMVKKLGMSKAGLAVTADDENPFGRGGFSQETLREMDLEIRVKLQAALDRARALFAANTAALDALVAAALEHERLDAEQIARIVAPFLKERPASGR